MAEEEIIWKIDGLEESFQNPDITFCKVCKSDGTAVGLAGWTIDNGFKRDSKVSTGDNKESLVKLQPKKAKDNQAELPRSLDISTWATVSEQFATEKRRVFQRLGMVWRKSIFGFLTRPNLNEPFDRSDYDIGKPFVPT